MEMPGYTDYGKMYEMNPGAFFQAQEQLGLAQQFQQQKQLQAEQTTQGMGLDNMFKQDSYGDRLRQGSANADLAGFNAREQGVKTRISEGTEALQLDASQRELVQKAKKADLDMMELEGQRMAYSPDPTIRAQGEAIIKLHKDFIKLREEGGIRAEAAKTAHGYSMALEGKRQAGQNALEDKRIAGKVAAKAAAGQGIDNVYKAVESGKVSPDKAAAAFGAAALRAQAEGDIEAYTKYALAASQMERLALTTKPDTKAGSTDTGAVTNLPTVPPRVPTFPPPTAAPQPSAAPKATMADVQKMYPGVPADKLRDAYKKKFGVDLQ